MNTYNIVSDILANPDKDKIISLLITKYADESLDNCDKLIDMLTSTVKRAEEHHVCMLKESHEAISWLINQREFSNKSTAYFASMVPICKCYFSNGIDTRSYSQAEQDYFTEFCKMLSNKKFFDFDNKEDVSWAKSLDYYDYIKTMYEKHKVN